MSNQIFMHGEFHTLYEQSIADDVKVLNYFRMSHPIFQELLARVTDVTKLQDTNMRPSIPPVEALALTIRYGNTQITTFIFFFILNKKYPNQLALITTVYIQIFHGIPYVTFCLE